MRSLQFPALFNQPYGGTPAAVAQADRQVGTKQQLITISFAVPDEHGPALRSAIEEISYELGARLEGTYSFAREDALTKAASAVGILRKAVNAQVQAEDPYYNPPQE